MEPNKNQHQHQTKTKQKPTAAMFFSQQQDFDFPQFIASNNQQFVCEGKLQPEPVLFEPEFDQHCQKDFFNSKGFFPVNTSDNVNTLNEQVGPQDIICGRCSTAFNNFGNRRFRLAISLNLQRYIDTPTRQDKSLAIKATIKLLRADGGARFLKRKGNKLLELNERQVRQKVGHALRDMAVLQQRTAGSTVSSSVSDNDLEQRSPKEIDEVESIDEIKVPGLHRDSNNILDTVRYHTSTINQTREATCSF
jgi:hypothetical protein